MSFCANCGYPIENGSFFCSNCGAPVIPTTNSYNIPTPVSLAIAKLFRMEKNQSICWGIIAIVQALFGVDSLSSAAYSYGDAGMDALLYFALAILNGFTAYQGYQFAHKIKNEPPLDLIKHYEDQITGIIVSAIIWLFAAPINLIGIIYEFRIRDHVLTYRNEIEYYVAFQNRQVK